MSDIPITEKLLLNAGGRQAAIPVFLISLKAGGVGLNLSAADTVEEKILRLQEKKRAAIDAAIDSEEPLMTGLTTEELEELLA